MILPTMLHNANCCKTIGSSRASSKYLRSLSMDSLLTRASYNSSSSVMAPFFANGSCDPFSPVFSPCTLGNYINYAIDVAESSDIVQGIAFATRHNIRLVIRNTGHEYVFPTDYGGVDLNGVKATMGSLQGRAHWQSGHTI